MILHISKLEEHDLEVYNGMIQGNLDGSDPLMQDLSAQYVTWPEGWSKHIKNLWQQIYVDQMPYERRGWYVDEEAYADIFRPNEEE